MPRRSPQRRNWVFVLNNPTEDETEYLQFTEPPNQEADHPLDENNIKFVFYQLERAPTTGTPHYQGFVMFNSAISRAEAKRRMGTDRISMRMMNGNVQQNIVYASKDDEEHIRLGGPWEFGTRPAQGARTDLRRYESLRVMLDEGRSLLDVAEEDFHSFLRFGRGLQAYKAMVESRPRETPRARTRLTIVLGHPGMGKNTWVRNAFPKAYWTSINTKWFDGYIPNVHDTIVVDEFVGQIPITTMNTWLGVDPTRVETKGGSHGFFAEDLVVMSNLAPMVWWSNTRVPLTTFFRRIDRLVVFKEKYVPEITLNVNVSSDGSADRSEPCEEIMRAMMAGF